MTTPIEAVQAQLEALDRRLAGEHQENREALREQAKKLDVIDEKVDRVVNVGVRHDEQIKTIQRGGGGLVALLLTAIGTLFAEWVRRGAGGH